VSLGPDEWEGIDDYHGAKMYWSHFDQETSIELVKNSGFRIIWDDIIESSGEFHYWILARK
jgi:hypothetical protein